MWGMLICIIVLVVGWNQGNLEDYFECGFEGSSSVGYDQLMVLAFFLVFELEIVYVLMIGGVWVLLISLFIIMELLIWGIAV